MSNPNEKAAPSPKNAASNPNGQHLTACRCLNQVPSRRDLIAALIFSRSVPSNVRSSAGELATRSAARDAREAADILCAVLDHQREEYS